jgi:hypothetical protein
MCTLPNMAAFCSSLMSCSPAMLFEFFVNDFQMVPVTSIVTGITSTEALIRCLCFTFHMRSMHTISIVTSFYVKILSPEIAMSINTHVPCKLTPIVTSCLLLRMVLSSFHWFITEFIEWYIPYFIPHTVLFLLLIYIVTWGWPSTRSETCRQPINKDNNI